MAFLLILAICLWGTSLLIINGVPHLYIMDYPPIDLVATQIAVDYFLTGIFMFALTFLVLYLCPIQKNKQR